MNFDEAIPYIIGIGIGLWLGPFIFNALFDYDRALSSDTLHDICVNLTNNTTVTGHIDGYGKLICEIPSYDHTTNIIVRQAGESK